MQNTSTATDLFFHLPLSGTLTSAVVVHRRLDNLERERRKIKDVFGHFTNETKTNKKQRNGTDLGSNLFMPRQDSFRDSFSFCTFALSAFLAVNILFIVLHVTDPHRTL